MPERDDFRASLDALRDQPEALIAIIVQLRAQVAALEARLRDLDDQNRGLRERVDAAERTAARQAAPFRRDPQQRTQAPKRPGRRAGHPGTWRAVPSQVDAAVTVPLVACPACGGPLTDVRPCIQYIEEVPPVRPHVTRVTTHVGHCRQCARAVRSTHPLQVSSAGGAARVQLGPRALALAAALHTRLGLTMRRTCEVLRTFSGLALTPGGLAHALARLAEGLQPAYDALRSAIRAGPVVHSDETSWWVGGPAWLWVATTPDTTLYEVAQSRGRTVIADVLGATFAGVLVSDCLAVYDGLPGRHHKCYAHHLKALRQTQATGPAPIAHQWDLLLHAAMAVKPLALSEADRAAHRTRLEAWADRLVGTPPQTAHEAPVCRRLARHRAELFTFLDHPAVPATNNLAERQLRPAVIARKLSCGNKTRRGATTWQVLASLAATATQRRTSFVDLVAQSVTL